MTFIGMAAQRLKAAKSKARKLRRKEKAKRLGTKRVTLTGAKKRLWALLSPAIRQASGPLCFTCDKPGNHAGHMFPKGRAHALSAWHPGNIQTQCFTCNINLGGNGAEFGRRYVARYGQEAFDYMAALSRVPHKWTVPEIEILIEKLRISLDHYQGYYEERYSLGKKAA